MRICIYFLQMDLLSTTVLSGMICTSHMWLHKFQLIKLKFSSLVSVPAFQELNSHMCSVATPPDSATQATFGGQAS